MSAIDREFRSIPKRRHGILHAGREQLEPRYCFFAPVAFVPHFIQDQYAVPVATDIDGDRDVDLFLISSATWYENTDGKGGFSKHLIAAECAPTAVADLDGDGDGDFISARSGSWCENIDGKNLASRHVITADANLTAFSVFDMDADGDGDVLTSSESLGVVWYENIDAKGNFGPRHVIFDDPSRSAFPSDVDQDGDLDVISEIQGVVDGATRAVVVWLENMDGDFSREHVIGSGDIGFNAFCDYRARPQVADIDGDGDADVLAVVGYLSRKIVWYENTDGKGTFSDEREIGTTSCRGPWHASDIDDDGDFDVLTSAYQSGILWYENRDGKGAFADAQTITLEDYSPGSFVEADFDGDFDIDVVAAAYDPYLAWYEQRLIGDANNDGVFDSSDLVAVFQTGKYEDGTPYNATFDEGDWNQDGDFDSSDLVLAFQAGQYESAAVPSGGQLAAAIDAIWEAALEAALGSATVLTLVNNRFQNHFGIPF